MVDNSVTTLPAVVDVLNDGRAKAALLIPQRTPDPPSIPRHVPVAVAPGPAPAVIVIANPGFIGPASAIDHCAIIFVRALVAGRVAHFDFIVGGFVNTSECGVINR